MSSFLQKATPFFEHIVLGFAFAAIGYVFFWTFNNTNNFFSILGMIAVCFGGLKILVGTIIYLGWLFALIFRPEYLKRKEQEEADAAAKKELEEDELEVEEDKPWFVKNIRFVVKHWGIILEVSALLIGLLTIVITRGV
jgi:hypothetical protein